MAFPLLAIVAVIGAVCAVIGVGKVGYDIYRDQAPRDDSKSSSDRPPSCICTKECGSCNCPSFSCSSSCSVCSVGFFKDINFCLGCVACPRKTNLAIDNKPEPVIIGANEPENTQREFIDPSPWKQNMNRSLGNMCTILSVVSTVIMVIYFIVDRFDKNIKISMNVKLIRLKDVIFLSFLAGVLNTIGVILYISYVFDYNKAIIVYVRSDLVAKYRLNFSVSFYLSVANAVFLFAQGVIFTFFYTRLKKESQPPSTSGGGMLSMFSSPSE